ncbi:DNA-binding response regulator [Streptomyces sp. NPDC057686]|uniref:DNA-binding response regulator n=1 Tax=Streptomyces sp. NPDC057686 TaxID=3346212 RepID=UPI0036A134E0
MPRNFRTTRSLRVLLAEGPGTHAGALAVLLGLEPDLDVVAQVAPGADVGAAALTACPAVALLDADRPDVLAEVAAVCGEAPECRVLLLAGSARPGLVEGALASGAAGVVLRDGPPGALADAVRRAVTGEAVTDPTFEP